MMEAGVFEKRLFSYEQAAALLPELHRLTEEAVRQVEALRESGEAAEARISHLVAAWTRGVMARGVEVKGLWLLDFDNGSGYYCWRYPERGIQYYHSYEDGFRSRIRIH
jgi:hypothetical protein